MKLFSWINVFSWIVTKQWYSNMCFLSNDLRVGTFFTYTCEVLWKLNFNNEIFICFILAKYEKENTYLIYYGVSRWSSILFWDTSKLPLTRLLLYISTKATILKVHWSHFGMGESKPRWVYRFVTNCKFLKNMNPPNDAYLEEMQTIPFCNIIGSLKYAMNMYKIRYCSSSGDCEIYHGQPH